jgi:hypothetical protein
MIPPGMNSVPDIVPLPPNLDPVSSEDLWHALAARYDALIFAGVATCTAPWRCWTAPVRAHRSPTWAWRAVGGDPSPG